MLFLALAVLGSSRLRQFTSFATTAPPYSQGVCSDNLICLTADVLFWCLHCRSRFGGFVVLLQLLSVVCCACGDYM